MFDSYLLKHLALKRDWRIKGDEDESIIDHSNNRNAAAYWLSR